MKIEGGLFMGGFFFYLLLALIYGFWAKEPAGTTVLALSAGLALIAGFYLLFTARHIDPRPEDNVDADVSDGAGDIGFFSPHSAWPLPVAAGAAITSLGVVVGWWLVFLGALVLGLSVIGFVFEYYRGEHAH